MREKSERETRGSKLGDTGTVVQKSGGMSGIRVAQSAEFFVVAGKESRTGMNSAADVDQSTVDPKAEFGHGIRFVNVGWRKELQSESAELFLCRDEETACVIAPSGNIQETDQNALGTHADGIIEVSGDAFPDEYGSNICPFNLREDGGNGFKYGGGDR
jgi:hypothetical protein